MSGQPAKIEHKPSRHFSSFCSLFSFFFSFCFCFSVCFSSFCFCSTSSDDDKLLKSDRWSEAFSEINEKIEELQLQLQKKNRKTSTSNGQSTKFTSAENSQVANF